MARHWSLKWKWKKDGRRASSSEIAAAIRRLASFDEVELSELVCEGRLEEAFPFVPDDMEDGSSADGHGRPPELQRFEDLQEAPARPLTDEEYRKFLKGE